MVFFFGLAYEPACTGSFYGTLRSLTGVRFPRNTGWLANLRFSPDPDWVLNPARILCRLCFIQLRAFRSRGAPSAASDARNKKAWIRRSRTQSRSGRAAARKPPVNACSVAQVPQGLRRISQVARSLSLDSLGCRPTGRGSLLAHCGSPKAVSWLPNARGSSAGTDRPSPIRVGAPP